MLESGRVAASETVMQSEEEREVDFCRVPSGFTARRERLLLDVMRRCRDGGVALVSAPAGFGKTALLLQYAAAIREDPAYGHALVIDASGMLGAEIAERIDAYLAETPQALHPVIVVDNVPRLTEADHNVLVDGIRAACDEGAEVVLSCLPTNRALTASMGKAACIYAKSLIVRPKEYAQWARLYSISSSLDVYRLTQGVPALIAMLQSVSGREPDAEMLDRSITGLYQASLNDLRTARDPLFRIAALMVVLGHGRIDDLERCGVRVRAESLARLERDWPLFNYAVHTREFHCLGTAGASSAALRGAVAKFSVHIVTHAARILVKAGRFDDAVRLCEQALEDADTISVVSMSPCGFALAGHGLFVTRLVARLDESSPTGTPLEVGALLATCLAALSIGEYRLARSALAELRRRADEVERDIDPKEWACAKAFSGFWSSRSALLMPRMSDTFENASRSSLAARLMKCQDDYERLVNGTGEMVAASARPSHGAHERQDQIDLLGIAEWCVRRLGAALRAVEAVEPMSREEVESLKRVLGERRLLPALIRVRMVDGIVRLMAGEPIGDERAFSDASTLAVRESDTGTQLLCMAAEGWQELSLGQTVNAQFRGQQVLRLAPQSAEFLRSWATMLEYCATLQSASMIGIREQADLLSLSDSEQDITRIWCTALHLSAARFDSELSAWYSLHKRMMLDSSFAPVARLAMMVLGDRAQPLLQLIPRSRAAVYRVHAEREQEDLGMLIPLNEVGEVGQVTINLFGGFRVMRNGHTLTDEVWRRKRASALAARLALSMDSFIDRKTVTEEMWPDMEYARARKSLYVTLSSLRAALQQQKNGPQYVVTQADGMCLNADYVASDVRRFDLLAREVLLKRAGKSAQDVIEDCLKLEQIYTGPLFIPDVGNPQFFVRMRRMYQSKFVDCMIRGIDVAIESENTASATWLTEAALRQASTREDVIRRAMTVFDLCGRRREVVELYNSHLHYLEHELKGLPEVETRMAYEKIVQRSKYAVLL